MKTPNHQRSGADLCARSWLDRIVDTTKPLEQPAPALAEVLGFLVEHPRDLRPIEATKAQADQLAVFIGKSVAELAARLDLHRRLRRIDHAARCVRWRVIQHAVEIAVSTSPALEGPIRPCQRGELGLDDCAEIRHQVLLGLERDRAISVIDDERSGDGLANIRGIPQVAQPRPDPRTHEHSYQAEQFGKRGILGD